MMDMTVARPRAVLRPALTEDRQWYKDAIIYQLHLKSFFDSNNDGVGDFAGLISKLDYIADLGVNTIWLLPFYPSPRLDDGYDIGDYRGVHQDYGTLADARRFIAAAHARGMRVITELVVNHTSDQHPWFQRARRAKPGSVYRDFYVWSHDDRKYAGTRVIFIDTLRSNWTWDEVAGAYYWHRFYSHQPDLNFDSPRVMKEVLSVLRYWLELGVDGLRLDAVPYLVEREGTNNENLPETHAVLKRIRAEIDQHYPDRMLLAEANQWPEDAKDYFGDDDECHMAFHFPADAAHVHGDRARGPLPDHRHIAPDAGDSPQQPVGDLPAQPRRVDAGDGDVQRARLPVGDLCGRPPCAAQPWHPAPAVAAARARPKTRRVDELPAVLHAGNAGDLLRRRDRHGRQHPSRRPRRRAHADAVVARPQRRILACGSLASDAAADHGSALWL
jgi:hypothetical protein